jgi:hypothetical protein
MLANASSHIAPGSSLKRKLRTCLTALFVVLVAGSGPASAEEKGDEFLQIETVVVDFRNGDLGVRSPSQDAFIEGLGGHGELHLAEDAELTSILGNRPYSAALVRGTTTLSAAILAFGSLDCASTLVRSASAILDLAAAAASGVDASTQLRKAYLYQFLCADRAGQVDDAMVAASMLRTIIKEDRPKEIGLDTWEKYPQVDAQSVWRKLPVKIDSKPSGATIFLNHEAVGETPSTLLLTEGKHLVALGLPGRGVSQQLTITGKGSVTLPLAETKSRWQGIAKALESAKGADSDRRPKRMGSLMAATLSEVAFVMREPGRVAVWILPPNRRSAELVGHAPNAAIAGEIALQGLVDSSIQPGLDPNMPLLRESDMTTTKSRDTKRWWVYGLVLGAAAIAAGVIVAQDLGEDTQRIEVMLP